MFVILINFVGYTRQSDEKYSDFSGNTISNKIRGDKNGRLSNTGMSIINGEGNFTIENLKTYF